MSPAKRSNDGSGKRRISRRPPNFAIQPDVIGMLGPGLQSLDPNKRVVVPLNPERRLHRPEHRDLTGLSVSTKSVASVSETYRSSGPRTRSAIKMAVP